MKIPHPRLGWCITGNPLPPPPIHRQLLSPPATALLSVSYRCITIRMGIKLFTWCTRESGCPICKLPHSASGKEERQKGGGKDCQKTRRTRSQSPPLRYSAYNHAFGGRKGHLALPTPEARDKASPSPNPVTAGVSSTHDKQISRVPQRRLLHVPKGVLCGSCPPMGCVYKLHPTCRGAVPRHLVQFPTILFTNACHKWGCDSTVLGTITGGAIPKY